MAQKTAGVQKNSTGLVAYAKAQLGKPYWYGTFGQKPTLALLEQKIEQFPYPKFKSYTPKRIPKFRAQIWTSDRVHDCVGLIKGYLWSATPTSKPVYNGAQDVSANGMRAACEVKGPIGTLPDVPGVLVFFDGHVGIYIGGGLVVEARGSDYGVVQTKVTERGWTSWGCCPWIDYNEQLRINNEQFVVGDSVRVKSGATTYYAGGPKIPARVKGVKYSVAQVEYNGTVMKKGGKPCVLLKEINTWTAVENLEKV